MLNGLELQLAILGQEGKTGRKDKTLLQKTGEYSSWGR